MRPIHPLPPPRCARLRWLAAAVFMLPSAALLAQSLDLTPPQAGQSPPPQFGAIAFTADGSFSAVWKRGSTGEAQTQVLAACAKFRRGECQVVSFREELCAAIASFRTAKDLKVTYAGGGVARADAKRSALERCNSDSRAHRTCQVRTVVCGDGR